MKRFYFDWMIADAVEDETGEYVLYADYALLVNHLERTLITKQRDGTNALRDGWAAFDETPAYITADPATVAAIDAQKGATP